MVFIINICTGFYIYHCNTMELTAPAGYYELRAAALKFEPCMQAIVSSKQLFSHG